MQHDDRAIHELSDLLAIYASPTRLSIAVSLTNAPGGEMAVHELAEVVAVSVSGLSQHLAKMKAHGLVIARRQAQAIFYRLAPGRPITTAVLGLLEGA